MSDETVKESETLSTKRDIKLTFKGLCFYTEMCQEKRSVKCKQAKKFVDKITALMESNENVNSVNLELSKLIQCCDDANELHESLINLPLPQDEMKRQCEYFAAKMIKLNDFTERAKTWLSELGHPYVFTECHDEQGVTDEIQADDITESPDGDADEIKPDDSASNVSSVKASCLKPPSQLSRTSSTASARIKAQAEKAALQERVAALKKKHSIEAMEEKLKREKEQLELETELAATNEKNLLFWRLIHLNVVQNGQTV